MKRKLTFTFAIGSAIAFFRRGIGLASAGTGVGGSCDMKLKSAQNEYCTEMNLLECRQ
jgi:hypothetical protein